MKKIIEFVKRHEPYTPVQEIKNAYKRESRTGGIEAGSDFRILEYLRLNKLTQEKP